MTLTHIHAFAEAMQHKDLEAMLSHMSEDIVLATPLAAEPVVGKDAVRRVVGTLLSVVEAFDVREILQGPEHVASFFRVRIGPQTVEGMDYWQLDDAGLIREMSVLWRPLPAIVAAQAILASA